MKKSTIILLFSLILSSAFGINAFASGSSSPKCNTKYPVVLAHGMGAQYEIAWGIMTYWNRIPDELEKEGADVYITSVNSMDSTAKKAKAWKAQVLQIMAITGAKKVNVIGHSHGSVYSRYAMSNLGLGTAVASHTSIAGPHRGSVIAELVLGMIKGNILEDVFNGVFGFLMGDKNNDTAQNLADLTRSYMVNVFNPNTPNVAGVYYQSYAYKIITLLGAGIFVPTWPIQKIYEGDNDGLVSVTSAQWGKFRGTVSGAWWAGVNHLGAVDMLWGITPGFDAPAHFENIVADLKGMGY